MKHPKNVFLIGPMGAGKSAVGRQLARMLHLTFLDSDEEIENRTGVDISFIFEKEGEASFRHRERECIANLTRRKNIVLATGGGAVLDEENRRNLTRNGTIVYLKTTVEHQLERTQHAKNRPLLADGEPRESLERLAAIRSPLYEGLATFSVDTSGCHVRAVTASVCKLLRSRDFEPLKN